MKMTVVISVVPLLLDAPLVRSMVETLSVQHAILLEDLHFLEQFVVMVILTLFLMEMEVVQNVQKDVLLVQKLLVQSVIQPVDIIFQDHYVVIPMTINTLMELLDVQLVQIWLKIVRLVQ